VRGVALGSRWAETIEKGKEGTFEAFDLEIRVYHPRETSELDFVDRGVAS
jgi:hypothetical protein